MRVNVKGVLPGVAASLAAIALLASSAVPAAAAGEPIIDVANPTSGDYIRRGGHFWFGSACDPTAPATAANAGIVKVSVYAADRDTADNGISWRPGSYLAAATTPSNGTLVPTSQIGMPTTGGPCKQANSGWRLRTPSLRKGIVDLHFYATAASGKESHLVVRNIRIDRPDAPATVY